MESVVGPWERVTRSLREDASGILKDEFTRELREGLHGALYIPIIRAPVK